MPNPKRKHSKSRTGMRRAPDHLTPANASACPNCGEPRLPHRVCSKCGYYRGRVVIAVKEEE
ncbi:MAG: large subunit ribosomal protein [Blastocatellia bacterium]